MLPVATNVGVGVGIGEGVGDWVGPGLAVGLGLRVGEGDVGLPPQPAMAKARTAAASGRLTEPGLVPTRRLPVSSELTQDDASEQRA
jgi:hypothetical protein